MIPPAGQGMAFCDANAAFGAAAAVAPAFGAARFGRDAGACWS